MSGEQETLNLGNAEEVGKIASGGSSSSDKPLLSRDSENIFSTVEGNDPGSSPSADDKKTDTEKAEAEKKAAEEKAAADTEAAKKAEDDRFDKHPRFQELRGTISELKERLAKAEGALEATRKPPVDDKQPPPFKDITQLSDDEIREWQTEDPKGYAANLYAQARHELLQEINSNTQRDFQNKGIKKTFEDYSAQNPTFMQMWNSGEISKFMEKNPGHNAISAHIILTQESRKGSDLANLEKWHKQELAKAVREAEDRVTKNFQAKKNATVLTGATTLPAQSGEDQELKDTHSRGGVVSVITERIKRMRQSAGQA